MPDKPLQIPTDALKQIEQVLSIHCQQMGMPYYPVRPVAESVLALIDFWQRVKPTQLMCDTDTSGFAIIGDMTREALIDEIMVYQVEALGMLDPDQLKIMLIQIRASKYQRRMLNEAQIRYQNPFNDGGDGGGGWFGVSS